MLSCTTQKILRVNSSKHKVMKYMVIGQLAKTTALSHNHSYKYRKKAPRETE